MIKKKLCMGLCILMLSTASFADFTIGVLGDTQYLSQSDNGGDMMKRMNQFFIDRKEELNVVFVTSNGDMTNSGGIQKEWERAAAAYEILWDAGIPYAPCQGNHDSLGSMNKYFPVSEFETRPYFGGYYQGIENAYYLFEAEGMEFLLLVHQMDSESDTKSWANDIFDQNPNRRGIFVVHDLDPGGWAQNDIVDNHDNIFMGITGHQCRDNGEDYWTNTSPGGFVQNLFLVDYQCRTNTGAFVRYFTFKPNEDSVCAFTYNVMEEAFERDEDSEFCFYYDMEPFGDGLPHNLQVSAGTGGTVSIGPLADGGVYAFNTPVTLTVEPMEGYQFDRWTGDITGAHNPAVPRMDSDKTITAIFKDCSVDRCIERITFPISSYGEERLDNGRVSIESDLLDLPRTDNGGDEQAVGLNFGNITLPPGIEIASAYIQFTSQEKEMTSTSVPSMDIWAEAVDNSSPFVAQDNNVTSRPTSTARVNWRLSRWKRPFRDGPNQQSSYLTSLIQEIVDRPGWKEGNSISFIIQRADDEVGGTKYRLAQTVPELVIDYVNKTEPVAVQPAKKVIKSRPAIVSEKLDN